jgi:hypothetical protein
MVRRKVAPTLLRRTLAERFDGKKTEVRFLAGAHGLGARTSQKETLQRLLRRKFFDALG